jgi:type IV pilus assembly protein PilC
MTKYAYVAVGPDGRRATGTAKARNRQEAEMALFGLHMRDIRVTERKSVFAAEILPKRVKREEVMHLSRQLGAFVGAGLPLIEAVHALGDEARNPTVRKMMADVEDGLRKGERLSDCLDRHPRIFPEFYRGILRSAELTGQLDTVLEQLARYLERDLEARRKIKAAMIYPSMIAVMSLVTVVVLATFTLPRYKVFFASMDAKLPLATRMLLAVTDFFTNWWWAIAAGTALLVLIVASILRTNGGQYTKDRLLLRIPVLGDVIRFSLVERFCRILSSMAAAGVALPEALRVATDSLRNRVFMRSLSRVGDSMLEGEGLARPLAASGLFPSTAARMIRVGEETGTLETQLGVTAHYYEGELDYKLKKLTALFEPLVIIIMGGIVGFVAVALVWAMYGIYGQIQI